MKPIGYSKIYSSVHAGKRQWASQSYKPGSNENVSVITSVRIERVWIEDMHAFGVQVDAIGTGAGQIFRAQNEVIVSAETYFPEIVTTEACLNYSALRKVKVPLMVSSSGIGSKSELNHRGIPQYLELPVGESLCDHVCIQTSWKIKDDITLVRQVSRSEWMSFRDNEPAVLNDAHRLLHGDGLERHVAPGKVHSLDRRLEKKLKYTTTVHFSHLGSTANPAFCCK